MVQGKMVNSAPRFLLDTVAKDAGTVSLDSYSLYSQLVCGDSTECSIQNGSEGYLHQRTEPKTMRTVNYGRYSAAKEMSQQPMKLTGSPPPSDYLSHIFSQVPVVLQRR